MSVPARQLRLAISAALAVTVAGLPAAPAGAQPSDDRNATAAREITALALANIQRARCGSTPCAPATDAERANPPIAETQARGIVAAGLISAFAEHCGLDWQMRSFAPLMRKLRTDLRFSERQMALAGVMHGIMQQTARDSLAGKPCTDQMRAETEKSLTASAPSTPRQ